MLEQGADLKQQTKARSVIVCLPAYHVESELLQSSTYLLDTIDA